VLLDADGAPMEEAEAEALLAQMRGRPCQPLAPPCNHHAVY
jgi:hypothetical protein